MSRSSFVRKGAKRLQDPGTRPGLHGQTLISTGLGGLDALLGGGLPLGTLTIILQDGSGPQCTDMLKYFLAEGVACGQVLSDWSGLLPKALCIATPQGHPDGPAGFIPSQQRSSGSSSSATDAQEASTEAELRIAWQYRRYIKTKAASDAKRQEQQETASGNSKRSAKLSLSGAAKEWCHRFDLGIPLGSDALDKSGCRCQMVETRGESAVKALESATVSLLEQIKTAEETGGTRGPLSVGRIAVERLGGAAWGLGSRGATATLRALYWLRWAVRDTRCAAVVTLDIGAFSESARRRLLHLGDAVATVQGLHDDSLLVALSPDPGTAVGLLRLLSSPSIGALGALPHGVEGERRLLRHKRRRLVLEEIDIDPDAEQALNDAAGDGMKASVSTACASPSTSAAAQKLGF